MIYDIPNFRGQGACHNQGDLFFPVGDTTKRRSPARIQADHAKAICHRCPVMGECLQWALEHGETWGVWGGLTETERRNLHTARGVMSA